MVTMIPKDARVSTLARVRPIVLQTVLQKWMSNILYQVVPQFVLQDHQDHCNTHESYAQVLALGANEEEQDVW